MATTVNSCCRYYVELVESQKLTELKFLEKLPIRYVNKLRVLHFIAVI